MSLFLAKKQEDNNQKKVRDLLRLKENKKCFDCPTKSPAFVNTTIQTFICARCSGLVREVGHRVKAVSASKFSGAELMALKKGGNGIALKIWLSNYSTHDAPEPEADADVRAFMKQKYYECKWLDRALLQSHKQEVRALIAKSFTEDGLPIVTKSRTRMIPGFSRVPLIADNEMNVMQDDEEEDLETSVIQGDSVIPPPIAVPVYAVPPPPSQVQPQYQHYPAAAAAATAACPMPPTSPVCRTSMDSINSYSSSSQGGSIYNYRSSQEMIRNDMYATNSPMQNVGNAQQQVASTETNILTAEQIAERCRSSIDSNTSSSSSPSSASSNRQSMEAPQQQPVNAVAPMVLTAEQIAERCRNTVDYKTSAELYQQQDAYTPPSVVSEVAAPVAPVVSVAPVVPVAPVAPVAPVEKSLPQLNIDVNNNDLVYHRHRSDYQVKAPTLVNYNNNQSPSIQRDVHQVPASASRRVTPSTSNPITKPTRPPMTAPAASASIFDSILSDLAGLKLEKTVRRATYTGGMLSPATPAAGNNSPFEPSKSSPHPTDRPASMFSTDFFSQLNKSKATENKSPENDPYAALRGIPAPVVAAPVAAKIDTTKDEERNTSSSSEDDDDEEDPWQEFCSSSSADGNEDNFLEPQQVIQPALEESKPVSNMIAIDLFSDLDPRSMFKRF